jgi:hypothetical protein
MTRKSNPYVVTAEDLDPADPFERDIASYLKRKSISYVNKADFERDKQAYKDAVEKEPVARKANHTYVPRSLKKPGWSLWHPKSIENWDPERDAMHWIVSTYTTIVHSIEDVEAKFREWLDKNRQNKKTPDNIIARVLRGKCHHGIANYTYCSGCEKWHLEVLDYLAKLRIRVLEYESQAEDDRKKKKEAAGRERRRQQKKSERSPDVGTMTAAYALEILGIEAGATEQEIRAAYNRLIKRVHPDVGGTDFLAKQLNAARDMLLR